MATPALSSMPKTCLGCLRRSTIQQPVSISTTTLQVRGKKNYRKKGSMREGVVVRLNRDYKAHGPKGTLMRITRGKFRNVWYSQNLATVISRAEMKRTGIQEEDIVGPNPSFGEKKEVHTMDLDTRLEQLELQAIGAHSLGSVVPGIGGSGGEATLSAAAAAALLRQKARARQVQQLQKEKLRLQKQEQQEDGGGAEGAAGGARKHGVALLTSGATGSTLAPPAEVAKFLRVALPPEFLFSRRLGRSPGSASSNATQEATYSYENNSGREEIQNPVTTNDVANQILKTLSKSRHPDKGRLLISHNDLWFVSPSLSDGKGNHKTPRRKSEIHTTGHFFVNISVRDSNLFDVRKNIKIVPNFDFADEEPVPKEEGNEAAAPVPAAAEKKPAQKRPAKPKQHNVKSRKELKLERKKQLDAEFEEMQARAASLEQTEPKAGQSKTEEAKPVAKVTEPKIEPKIEPKMESKPEVKIEPKVTETTTTLRGEAVAQTQAETIPEPEFQPPKPPARRVNPLIRR